MTSAPSRLAAGAALALAVLGCGSGVGPEGRSCTLIGCANSVSVAVEQPGERPLEVCVDTTCSPPGPNLSITGLELGDAVEVVVRVSGGAEVARVTANPTGRRPNGQHCPPACKEVRLRLTVEDQLVPA